MKLSNIRIGRVVPVRITTALVGKNESGLPYSRRCGKPIANTTFDKLTIRETDLAKPRKKSPFWTNYPRRKRTIYLRRFLS